MYFNLSSLYCIFIDIHEYVRTNFTGTPNDEIPINEGDVQQVEVIEHPFLVETNPDSGFDDYGPNVLKRAFTDIQRVMEKPITVRHGRDLVNEYTEMSTILPGAFPWLFQLGYPYYNRKPPTDAAIKHMLNQASNIFTNEFELQAGPSGLYLSVRASVTDGRTTVQTVLRPSSSVTYVRFAKTCVRSV